MTRINADGKKKMIVARGKFSLCLLALIRVISVIRGSTILSGYSAPPPPASKFAKKQEVKGLPWAPIARRRKRVSSTAKAIGGS
jgi:hypothetical protein